MRCEAELGERFRSEMNAIEDCEAQWRAVAARSSDWSSRNWVVTAGKTPAQLAIIRRPSLDLKEQAGNNVPGLSLLEAGS
mgnify:CR=1 FL=1